MNKSNGLYPHEAYSLAEESDITNFRCEKVYIEVQVAVSGYRNNNNNNVIEGVANIYIALICICASH